MRGKRLSKKNGGRNSPRSGKQKQKQKLKPLKRPKRKQKGSARKRKLLKQSTWNKRRCACCLRRANVWPRRLALVDVSMIDLAAQIHLPDEVVPAECHGWSEKALSEERSHDRRHQSALCEGRVCATKRIVARGPKAPDVNLVTGEIWTLTVADGERVVYYGIVAEVLPADGGETIREVRRPDEENVVGRGLHHEELTARETIHPHDVGDRDRVVRPILIDMFPARTAGETTVATGIETETEIAIGANENGTAIGTARRIKIGIATASATTSAIARRNEILPWTDDAATPTGPDLVVDEW